MFASLVSSAKEAVSRKITAIGLWAVAGVLALVALAYFVGSLTIGCFRSSAPLGPMPCSAQPSW